MQEGSSPETTSRIQSLEADIENFKRLKEIVAAKPDIADYLVRHLSVTKRQATRINITTAVLLLILGAALGSFLGSIVTLIQKLIH